MMFYLFLESYDYFIFYFQQVTLSAFHLNIRLNHFSLDPNSFTILESHMSLKESDQTR